MPARVLVVEPNRIVRRGICAELVAGGASVVAEAESGTEAVATAVEHRPDVVLLDSRLPDGSGTEVCAAILKRQPGTAVILLSAERDERAVEAALDSGARGFLVNVARGRLINEADLSEALTAGRIAGAGLDVFVDEPRVPLALRQSDRVTLQAHRASATWETRTAMGEMVLDGIVQALAGERPTMSLTT